MPFTVVQFKKMVVGLVPAAITTQYAVPAASQDVLKCIDMCNTTGTAVTVNLYLVPNASSAAQGNLLLGVTIPAFTTLHWTGTQVLNTGDTIQTSSGTANTVSLLVSGLEST